MLKLGTDLDVGEWMSGFYYIQTTGFDSPLK